MVNVLWLINTIVTTIILISLIISIQVLQALWGASRPVYENSCYLKIGSNFKKEQYTDTLILIIKFFLYFPCFFFSFFKRKGEKISQLLFL